MGGTSKLLMLLSSPFPLLYPRTSALRLVRVSSATLSSISKRNTTFTLPHLPFSVNSSSQHHLHTHSSARDDFYPSPSPFPSTTISRVPHPWPEWSNLVDNLRHSGFFDNRGQVPELIGDDALAVFENLPREEFLRDASACLLFARQRPQLLQSLSRKDIEVVVENGSPFLFKSAVESAARMKSFLGSNQNNQLVFERAHMVDLMRFLLSYVYNPVVSDQTNLSNGEFVESSVRNLLRELAYESRVVHEPELSASLANHFPDGYGQSSRPLRQNIEMKRGDWICPKCSFMNFARNMNCLECDETRPKRQLTGGEWDCPQCNFYNYGKNVVCLKCDCRCPGEASGLTGSRFGPEYSNENPAGNFNAMTPTLERRTSTAHYQGTLGHSGNNERNNFQSTDGVGPGRSSGKSINQNLDSILGRASERSKSEYVPFKPLPSDMFNTPDQVTNDTFAAAAAAETNEIGSSSKFGESSSNSGDSLPLSRKPVNQVEIKEDKEQAEKSERWFKKMAEMHDVTDLASAISDEDFPEIMPMRKGENRFVVSKKKDRSLTSPVAKRRMAMEQTSNSTNFVPFVPFPPDYFAKKDKVPEAEASTRKDISGTSTFVAPEIHGMAEKSEELKTGALDSGAFSSSTQSSNNQQSSREGGDTSFSGNKFSENRVNYSNERPIGNSTEAPNIWRTGSRQSSGSGPWEENKSRPTSSTGNFSQQSENAQKETWKGGFSGKSLEGSLVKEPDPLDMSEEAKAERWFRRAAQIKDISELSQIPDEDFPQIMPMRKGVNRFVVSKRKTPLERRLTSPQYRRNLPIVSSEPIKKENTES